MPRALLCELCLRKRKVAQRLRRVAAALRLEEHELLAHAARERVVRLARPPLPCLRLAQLRLRLRRSTRVCGR